MKKIILVLMLAVFGFSYSNDETYNITKNYSIENINSLSISTKYARVEVLPTDSKDVTLEVTSNKEVKFIIKNQQDTLYLTVLSSKVNSTSFLGRLFGYDVETSIIVKIPKNFNKNLDLDARNRDINISDLALNLNVNTANSDIEISNITGDSSLKSSNGDITVINNTGNIKGKTSNGSINIVNNKGNIKFRASNSNITVSNIDGFVDLKTSNNSILLTNASFITNLETSNGNITLNSDTLSKNGNIKTSNGDLELNINKLEGNNKISTSNGLITLTTKKGEFNSNSYSKEKVQDISKNINVGGRNLDNITIIKK